MHGTCICTRQNWRVFNWFPRPYRRLQFFCWPLKDFHCFASCNCFQKQKICLQEGKKCCFVAVITQAAYAKIDSFRARPAIQQHNPLMAHDGRTFNIFPLCGEPEISATFRTTTIKYLILPLATADYDQHLMHQALHMMFTNGFSSLYLAMLGEAKFQQSTS